MPSYLTQIATAWHAQLLAILLGAYVLWPARENLLLAGLPFTAIGLAAVCALVLALVLRPSPPRDGAIAAAAALLIVKVIAGVFVLPTGWAGRYYANEKFEGAYELSTDFKGQPWTRIDREIDFSGNRFPLHFMNELRYNFKADRRSSPFSVHYVGHATLDQPATLRAVVSSGSGFEVLVDGTAILTRPFTERTHALMAANAPLQAGPHQFEIRFVSPSHVPRKLAVRLFVASTNQPTVQHHDLAPIRPVAATAGQETRSRWLRRLLFLTDLMVLGIIALFLSRAARAWWRSAAPAIATDAPASPTVARMPNGLTVATLVTLAVLLVALFVKWDSVPSRLILIASGYDAIGYEDNARAILLGDWLLNSPRSEMRGHPIFYTMGYPLMMAATHVFFGESVWPIYFLQDWMMWAVIALAAAVARRLGGWPAALVAIVAGVYMKYFLFWPAHFLLRETLIVFLNAILVFLFTSRAPLTVRRAVLMGAIAGYNYLVDPPNLGALPLMLWLVYRMAPADLRRRCVVAFAGAWLVLFSVIPTRNLLVIHKPTPVPLEGALGVWMGNRPPPEVFPDPPPDRRFTDAVWTYAKEAPAHFATNIAHKVAWALGFFSPTMWPHYNTQQDSMVVFVTWICSGLGVMLALRQHAGASLMVLMALIRAGTIVAIVADYRYLFPIPLLLLPIAAVGFMTVWQFRKLLALVFVLVIGIDHYVMAKPQIGINVPWPTGRLMGPASYPAVRRIAEKTFPVTTRLVWRFPEHIALWKHEPGVGVLNDETTMIQVLSRTSPVLASSRVLVSPALGVPAVLVKEIEIEAAFTGWHNYAVLAWYRDGRFEFTSYFPVDHTGRMHTYRIPVWQSRDWKGTIERVEIWFDGDIVEPKRIELLTYPDVVMRDVSAQ